MASNTAGAGTVGIGELDPYSATSEFKVIAFIARSLISKLDTMKLVKVMKVTGGGGAIAKAGTVDVLPLVSLIDAARKTIKQGTVFGIPWWRLQGGTNALIVDPKVGDIGYVICSDRDISAVKSAAGADKDPQTTPGSFRKYSIADGVYVGGVLNAIPDQYIAFTDDGVKLTDKNGNVIETKATGIELTPKAGTPVKVNGDLVVTGNFLFGGNVLAQSGGVYAGNFVTSGQVTAAGVGLSTHHHTQGVDSRGDTEQPTSTGVG